jgi:hypothetical protein
MQGKAYNVVRSSRAAAWEVVRQMRSARPTTAFWATGEGKTGRSKTNETGGNHA